MVSKHNKKTYKKYLQLRGLVTRIEKSTDNKQPHQRHKSYKFLQSVKDWF